MQVNIEINEQQAQVAAKDIQFLENDDNRKAVIDLQNGHRTGLMTTI